MLKRLLITGAAGGIGQEMRNRLSHMAEIIRVSDKAALGDAGANEEVMECNLADKDAVFKLVEGCDGILHLGGISIEDSWTPIKDGNIDGIVNLYEAARLLGHPRIIFASTNHTVGFYRQSERIDSKVYPQPDSLYGASKVFGEAIANVYHSKFGIETAIVRIGSCFPEPQTHRQLSLWLSYRDFVSLIECIFRAPRLGCPIIYGVSNNDSTWWDNRHVSYLGWVPKDNAETFRAHLDATLPYPDKNAPDTIYQGGLFTSDGIHED